MLVETLNPSKLLLKNKIHNNLRAYVCMHCIESLLEIENKQRHRKATGENNTGCYCVTGYHTCCYSNQCNMADSVFLCVCVDIISTVQTCLQASLLS